MKSKSKKYNIITRENIKEMVLLFYTKILDRKDNTAEVFILELGNNLKSNQWIEHIEILTNFWSMITLNHDSYDADPMTAHFDLDLTEDMFIVWIKMFFEAVDEKYEDNIGLLFKKNAEEIAIKFMRNMGI